jgi:hypothetical protein
MKHHAIKRISENCTNSDTNLPSPDFPERFGVVDRTGKGVWENEAPNVDNSFSGSIFSIFPKIATEVYYDRK